MSIISSPKTFATQLRRASLVASAVSVLVAITFVVWLVLPRGQITIWTESSKSWILSEIRGPYTPTEDLLIFSSAFSVVVSTILESLLLFTLRNKSKQTKTWLKYTLYTILFANAALASTAFLYASVSPTVPSGSCTSITSDITSDEYGHHRERNSRTWDLTEPEQGSSYGEGFLCGRRIVSRWLSLLISFFSIVLLVSAWLDFREQDRRESETSQLDEESLGEKGLISTDSIGTMA
ncbi:hypothetical protein F4781DRAFT_389009 [Annulohypoxylon bovei var. microspora]|nr:hypothetical protein F4781DRAFT_389009 [Annulohypoxylon bovei var. microspora]